MFDQILSDLKRDEGWSPTPYKDSLGYWTLGYGFLIDVRKPVRLPREVGEVWLRYEVERRYEELLERIPWLMEQPDSVKRALTNMAFQLGVTGVLNFAKMLAALRSGDRELASSEVLNSRYADQTPVRARRIAALIGGEK